MADALSKHDEDMEALILRSQTAWDKALLSAKILAVAGSRIGGIHLRCRASPVRNAFLSHLQHLSGMEKKWIRINPQISSSRLCGGLDISATAKAGYPVCENGVLHQVNEGTLVIALAEKLEASTAAIISRSMDTGQCANMYAGAGTQPARFTVIAIDEGLDSSETIPPALNDRLGLVVDLNEVAWHHTAIPPEEPNITHWSMCEDAEVSPQTLELFATLTGAFPGNSMRALLHLVTVAKTVAALDGKKTVEASHAATAIALCLGFLPQLIEQAEENNDPASKSSSDDPVQDSLQPQSEKDRQEPDKRGPDDEDSKNQLDLQQLLDMAVEKQKASDLSGLNMATAATTRDSRASSGKSGMAKSGARRGRPLGMVNIPPYPDARPDIAATIRTAAPWQNLRKNKAVVADTGTTRRLSIFTSDFRYKRYKHATRSAAIFVVDASGSTALERLGETKGAIELLLANCYIRRDEVSLITFRDVAAEITLEPTRSLVRAKRALSEMAGGGPTPLASAMKLAFQTALNVRRKGYTPVIVLLTDGSGNIDLGGQPNRKTAAQDTDILARQISMAGIKSICIDVARRPRQAVVELANTMGAEYCALPNANATNMSQLVNRHMENSKT